MSETRIDIIRHGEPEGGRRYRGHGVDDPLSRTGWQQMWSAVPEKPDWEHIVTSPLSRCRSFAEALANTLGIAYTVEDDLKEIGFGVWEGRSPDDIKQHDGDALERFTLDPVHNRPQGAEPLDTFADRVWTVYERTMQEYRGQQILMVAHAGVIRAITSHVLGMRLDDVYSRLKIDYAAIVSTQVPDRQQPVLVLR